MKLVTKVLIGLVILVEGYTLTLWIACQKFVDAFHFSSLDATLKLLEAIRNDVGYTPTLARFFHNKANIFSSEFINRYLAFWDIRFDVLFFSIIGVFGILCGFWYLYSSRLKVMLKWFIGIVVVSLPLVIVLQPSVPYIVQLFVVWVPLQVLSLYGLWNFLKPKRVRIFIVLLLVLLSVWYLSVFQKEIFVFCLKP